MSLVLPNGYYRFSDIAHCLKYRGWNVQLPSYLGDLSKDVTIQLGRRAEYVDLSSTLWWISDYMAPLLSSGEIQSGGIMTRTGELFFIPPSVWRVGHHLEIQGFGHATIVDQAFCDREIPILRADGSFDFAHAVMSGKNLAEAFSSKNPPPPPYAGPVHLPEFAPKMVEATNEGRTAPFIARTKGGRPTASYWDDFWTELVLFADLDALPADKPETQRHMKQWAANREAEGKAAPDEKTIREKLTNLYQERIGRARSTSG